VDYHPAEPNAGVTFVRSDLPEKPRSPASVEFHRETPRRTTLENDGAHVEMIEHIMAALAGMRVDNCEVHMDAPEAPGCDGSSLAFVEALDSVGFAEQDAVARFIKVHEDLRVGDDKAWIEATPSDAGPTALSVKFHIDYGPSGPISRQTIQLDVDPESFRRELAPSRTFVLQHEAEWLRSQGIAQRPTEKDLLIFNDDGPINNTLRFDDECVRHKALDLIGDLALTGRRPVGCFVAHCSGHRLNAQTARALLEQDERNRGRRRTA
ncbi:MAG: UDP-3-O-acyl-N-acetylglucosamine deacetylase, partial [Planctomycetales bacterium]